MSREIDRKAKSMGYTRSVRVGLENGDYWGWCRPSADHNVHFSFMDSSTGAVTIVDGACADVADLED